ncbi:MAG TPA: hypothetical protein PKD93_06485, partial [Ferruginibacter sp.]|nr:hypothetical protein [Ferruginibacter sp.]
MKKLTQLIVTVTTLAVLAACGGSNKDAAALISDKKAAIEKLKSQNTKNEEEIKKLQAELEKIDSNAANAAKIKLV